MKGTRKRRTKKEIEEAKAVKKSAEGLGDTIETILEATGVAKIAKWVLGEDCKCEERKEKLNKMFPYNKPLCLTESEYEWLHNYYTEQKNTIDMKKQKEFLEIYNRVMQTKEVPTTCSDCYRDWHRRMHKIYNEYADNKSMVNNQRR